jgi:hypothetical protein
VGGRGGDPLCNGTRQEHRILKRGRGIGEEQREEFPEPCGVVNSIIYRIVREIAETEWGDSTSGQSN